LPDNIALALVVLLVLALAVPAFLAETTNARTRHYLADRDRRT
jgi:hypothetical protein